MRPLKGPYYGGYTKMYSSACAAYPMTCSEEKVFPGQHHTNYDDDAGESGYLVNRRSRGQVI